MDDTVTAAVTAVPFDTEERARQWFALVCGVYRTVQEEQGGWEAYVRALRQAAPENSPSYPDEEVELFLRVLAESTSSPLDTVAAMAADEPELIRHHQAAQAAQPADDAGPAADADYDEQEWLDFLAEHGVRWDGQDETWPDFVKWFSAEAAERGVGAPATAFIAYAAAAGDRVGVFAEYGITIGAEDPAQPETEEPQSDTMTAATSLANDVVAPALADLRAAEPLLVARIADEDLTALIGELLAEGIDSMSARTD